MAKRLTKAELVKHYEKRIYDLEQLLDIARSFSSTIEIDNLLESISFSCMAQLHVADAGIFVLDFLTSDNFVLKTKKTDLQINFNEDVGDDFSSVMAPTVLTYQIPFNDPVIKIISDANGPITLADLKKAVSNSEGLQIFCDLNPTLIVPLMQRNQITGILFLGERFFFNEDEGSDYTSYEKSLVLSIASLAASAINNATLIERSSTDMMTQLKLKYFFFNVLGEKLDTAYTNKKELSVIMFDIDFFKHFNDNYGHEYGDYVLKTVAQIIKDNLREGDLASRYGGEEFTVLLNNTQKDDAMMVAERIREAIEDYDFAYHGRHTKVTISGGVAVFDVETNPIKRANKLVSLADQGLYMSKQMGRNRVTYAYPGLKVVDG